MPLVGILSAAIIYAGIFAALRAMRWIRRSFEARGVPETALGLPSLFTPPRILRFGLAAPVLPPGVFLCACGWLLWNPST